MKDIFWENNIPTLKLSGSGTRSFLNGQTTANILKAEKGQFVKCCWLYTSGKIRCLLEILLHDNGAEVAVIAGNTQNIYEEFDRVIFPADRVEIGPIKEIRRVQKLSYKESWKNTYVVWLKENQLLTECIQNSKIATFEEFEKWRLFQGIPASPGEINGETNPFELGVSDLISFDKGCYLGQETIAKINRNSLVKQKLMYWESDDPILIGEKLISESQVKCNKHAKNVGFVTSSIISASGNSNGLAIIRKQYLDQSELLSCNGSKKINIKIPLGFAE